MATTGIFVTGTDTDVGKTLVSLTLMEALKGRGLRVSAMKPVSAGCERTPAGLRNEDALALAAACSQPADYDLINPFAFAPPIAPHIAATQAGVTVSLDVIQDRFRQLGEGMDCVVVEGAGGWLVPLNGRDTMADLAVCLELPVVLVVGMRLGCLNHALLTADAIAATGLPCAGWVANELMPPMAELDANVATLQRSLDAPLLGRLPWMDRPDPSALAALLDPDRLRPGCY